MSAPRAFPPLTLVESADLLGRYRYVELAIFTVLGHRAPNSSAPAVALYLAGASLAHGHHAGLLESRLPVSVGLPDAAALTRSPHPAFDEALGVLECADDWGVLDGLLGALYPAIVDGYARHVVSASPFADPPIVRLLGRLLADLEALRREGAELAGTLAPGGTAVSRTVEALLSEAGGPFG